MKPDIYLSLSGVSEGLYKEKGSKFLAFAYPIETEEAVKIVMDDLKKQYHDARHHCYAFVLKPQTGREESYRAHDGGEPPHSAGDPILGQIRSFGLQDTLIAVVRYFGGTKLGVNGLIHAYKTAAADAIAHNKVVEKVIQQSLSVRYTYAATPEVMQLLQHYQLEIREQQFGEDCYYRLGVRQSVLQEVRHKFSQIAGVQLLAS